MNNYDSLLKKYNTLLLENDRLRKENADLRSQLNFNADVCAPNNSVAENQENVTNKSTPDAKIDLFMSLFVGRDDVFAKRWHSVGTGKSGYQPVCENEWEIGLCDKKKYKCSVCLNRKLKPLERKDIYAHLSGKDAYGRDVIGIYPMLSDETCRFLAVDFDDDGYEKDAVAYKVVCGEHGVPAYIERSRSGSGAHIWMFFEENIPAVLARKLGSIMLTEAMKKNSNIKLSSYDRLFPNQDNMPKGGFGNLIALPMQGAARKNGNSVFVDENFVPFADQWQFLFGIKKMSLSEVESVVSTFNKNAELGELVTENDKQAKPWEQIKISELSAVDFPKTVNITRANMVYIEKSGLSSKAVNRIRRLAAFKNPDFYKAQAMRLPIYDKPRVISTAYDDDDYIGLPRGCEESLTELLDSYDVLYTIEDKTSPGVPTDICFNGELRDEQIPAAEALLAHNNGVLSATTAFGKTVIGAYLIAQRKVNTLVLVHTVALLEQWKAALNRFIVINADAPEQPKGRGRKKKWEPIGTLGAGKNNFSGIVDIAVMQSLLDADGVKDIARNYGMIIVDECHHVPAFNFEKILKSCNARYVYGLSATPTRPDGHHPIIGMQCGKVRYVVSAKEQAEKRSFSHIIVPRFTSFRSNKSDEKTITQLYSELAEDDYRNSLIINDAIKATCNGRIPIILTERTEHVAILAAKLSDKCKNVISLTGTMSAKEKRETKARLESVPDDEPLIVVASGRYVGEGFDYPRLDTLLLALPIAWKGKVAQYAGRLHRDYPGKTEVQIYDYADIHIPVLERMYQKRVKSYASIGYQVRAYADDSSKTSIIYDNKSFKSVFDRDILSAAAEVVIVSPFMRKSRVKSLLEMLFAVASKGVKVTVVTRLVEDFKDSNADDVKECVELLKKANVEVKFKSGFHQKSAIIDGEIVWYGSINFLSFGTNEESVMRFESARLAGELLETVKDCG